MSEALLAHEAIWRFACFFAVFAAMAAWEVTSPRRLQRIPKMFRWSNNLAIMILDALVLRYGFPLLAVGLATIAEVNNWGLLNLIAMPVWVAFFISLFVMDLIIYFQHVMFHKVPILWRLHRMHHADLEFDVTTGIRFHPVEIVVSMSIKLATVLALGPPVLAVIVFEILLNATALFNHSNAKIPLKFDKILRWFVVTPDMHRVHHSVIPYETNSNYGFNLPWWDRILGTYRDQPRNGHLEMTIGLEQFRSQIDLRLDQMLIQPLRKQTHSSSESQSS
ncbi:MAG: sterol desaturase/sphingolipid hydroxylase (fatty acid hydroxylase superfamily) [Granulosicoccus sp.]|jgi:sterol desaturase/sphingolipid hydroxylase (fatty acid hydroxylase superfamily)